ncbi:undecaprenyl-diphosphate phosphatase [Clostridium intestinale]|uniref:Undecaprenyl-diphosphatase n=1 Tax=Clostridium intestinale URNW TaxID=1294142 RepID=U2PS90_9CLOT|nr:undecaprenyl-diphosphate phosphatase [Clostridium intestinale]ERK29330.1 Undecaprenyl-diphosphatase [Clostridium intestinale URNW]
MDNLIFLLKSAIIGIVEGITEFLPISSTGHIIIFQNLLGFQGDNETYVNMYAYVIQLGAILAVIVLYWRKIKETLLNFFPGKVGYEKSGFKFWFMIVIACIPGAVVQLTLDDLADKYLFNTVSVAITLVLGAVWMLYAENRFRNVSGAKEINISPKQAIIIGLFQCLAIIPGMSRSASTIIGGWIAGLSTVAAAEFSFFLAIPVMMGMSLLKFIKIGGVSTLTSIEIISLGVGFLVSFIVALIVIKKFIEYLKKKPMKVFVIYRMVFGIIILIAGFSGLFSIN